MGLSLTKGGYELYEPEIWEQVNFIPIMENTVIQACKCVEGILGMPSYSNKKTKKWAAKQDWINKVGIDPDDEFNRTQQSYMEFYLHLFTNLRNPSVHSYGNIQFELERNKVLDAQCFVALISRAYVEKNILSYEEIFKLLYFNSDLL